MKIFLMVILFILLSVIGFCETFTIKDKPQQGFDIVVSNKSPVSTEETLLTILMQSQKYPNRYVSDSYIFTGRTGEKSFDIKHDIINTGREVNTTEKLSVFISEEDPSFLIKLPFFIKHCSIKDEIILKKLELKGNKLFFVLILPECLKPE